MMNLTGKQFPPNDAQNRFQNALLGLGFRETLGERGQPRQPSSPADSPKALGTSETLHALSTAAMPPATGAQKEEKPKTDHNSQQQSTTFALEALHQAVSKKTLNPSEAQVQGQAEPVEIQAKPLKSSGLKKAGSALAKTVKFGAKVAAYGAKTALVGAALITAGSYALNTGCEYEALSNEVCQASLPYSQEVATTTAAGAEAIGQAGLAALEFSYDKGTELASLAWDSLSHAASQASDFVMSYFEEPPKKKTGIFGIGHLGL